MELQNQIRLNDMEAKIYNLKIESLRAEKRRLEAQVADYARVVTELEAVYGGNLGPMLNRTGNRS